MLHVKSSGTASCVLFKGACGPLQQGLQALAVPRIMLLLLLMVVLLIISEPWEIDGIVSTSVRTFALADDEQFNFSSNCGER